MGHLYSIIIATKNNELTIRHVLRSTLIIAENYETELLVVDGKSSDSTLKIVEKFMDENRQYYRSLKILRDPGFSLSFARHLGFKNSRGNVLIFLDGDTPLTTSFKYYLERELEEADLISPMFEVIPLDKATRVFNWFMKSVSYIQNEIALTRGIINDPSILPPARIYKRRVLERMKGYPISSRFFGEDRVTTALAVRLGFRYRFSISLKLLKIDEPSYISYWRKHYRYALGVCKDSTRLGMRLLRGYVVSRRLNHLNIIFPVFSFIYGLKVYIHTKDLRNVIEVALMKYFVDTAMFLGDLACFFKSTVQ